jgi:hypothetical protein
MDDMDTMDLARSVTALWVYFVHKVHNANGFGRSFQANRRFQD